MEDGLKQIYTIISKLVAMTPNMSEKHYASMLKKVEPMSKPHKMHLFLNAINIEATTEVDLAAMKVRNGFGLPMLLL